MPGMENGQPPLGSQATSQHATPSDAALPAVIYEHPSDGVTTALVGIAESSARSFGSGPVAKLITGHVTQLEASCRSLERDLRGARSKIEGLQSELGQTKIELAVERERSTSARGIGAVRVVLTTVGLSLIGVAVELFKSSVMIPAAVVAVAGAVLTLAGWLLPFGRNK